MPRAWSPPPQPWMAEALCRYADPAAWDLDNYPDGHVTRARLAERVCRGCPVARHCAQWAHDHVLTTGEDLNGIVCAGVVFGFSSNAGRCEKARRRVADRHGLTFVPRPTSERETSGTPCRRCGRITVAQGAPVPDGGVRYGAHGLCHGCTRSYYTAKYQRGQEK
ncbi:WhiB family transcriptional regulator [Nocardia terpenica]|uniref:WhiB family transcriptional regulator n=1 Tax=Nocardia terpenica TaxID=455432 RepID=UPI001892E617|nr:WhiB family transcriptional regulator [Nocardia terpenica]MBF6060542.1 WhiB family transcriptional regulator [Nocardia terpenica]MBF6103802.1 WhiB family transcriptional regulator [Nocardia terpenica]MBF6111824.1 WhiB family transcriptional regulator [Nocardia terpenica]MBF6118023.1 WhiB family transcriptional regulator [Nocardia terpenica]MBF6155251.1 WhiB family transcriptional regulator [Nocardia terpenica]